MLAMGLLSGCPVVSSLTATTSVIATEKHIIIGTNKIHTLLENLDDDLLRNTRKTY